MGKKRGVTAGKKSEREAWLEKLQFLNDAMEATSQPFAAGSPEGALMIFNEAFCRLTGYTREELRALSWATDLTMPESRSHEHEILKALDSTHEPQRYDKDYIRKDGTIISVELFTHAAPDSHGNILYYYSFITDISERKRKEEELHRARDTLESVVQERTAALGRSEERLLRMIDMSPVPMIVFEDSRNDFVNKKFVEVFGYTMEDIPSVNEWWPLAYPEKEYQEFVKKRWYAAVDEAVKNKTSIEPQEVVVTCKDGSQKHVLNYFSSIGDLNLSVFYDITGRKRAEAALKESEEKYRDLVENANSIILRWDVNGRITFFNEFAQKFFGYSPGEIVGKDVMILVPATETSGRDISLLMDNITRSPEQFANNVNENVRKNGERVWVSWTNKALYDKQGNPAEIMAIGNDITERKRAEEVLHRTLQRFYYILSNMRASVLLVTHEERIEYANQAFCDYFSLCESPENLVGLSASEMIGKIKNTYSDPDRAVARIKEIVSLQQPVIGEEVTMHDGRTCLRDFVPLPIDGELSGRLWLHLDITERKRAEEQRERLLKDAEEQRAWLQAILDALPIGVTIADATGRILLNNDALHMIWGGKAPLSEDIEEYAEYKGWWADTGKPVLPEEWGLARTVTKGETSVGEVIDIQRFDGTHGTMLNSAAPVKDASGKIIGAVVILQDITQRREMERDLSDAKAQAELYLDLMGHDISNMHQIIMMQLELALSVLDEEGRLEQKDRDMIATSLKTLDRSVNLIGNVRTLQKVRSGEYKAEPLDLGHVIGDVVKTYAHIPGRDITIKYAPTDGHLVMASPLIKDVLGNLVDNAVKHSKDPVAINIDLSRVRFKGVAYNRVSVEDNGIGIPDEKKDVIFQRFKRGQTVAKGTGLGLYIVKTLVEGFGGHVKVEDRVTGDHTKGARFVVYLPAAEAEK